MIRCMAIDDEPLALQQIAAYIQKVPFLELAAQCQSALEARSFLERDTVDAIFCDINMPDLNGMDFVKSLANPVPVVFTTAYSEYAVEGFRVNAVDYLLKPFGLQDFQRAANRLRERWESHSSVAGDSPADTLFLKANYRIVKVHIPDIRYIEAMSEYLKVWIEGEPKPIITLLSMKKMEERLRVGERSSGMRLRVGERSSGMRLRAGDQRSGMRLRAGDQRSGMRLPGNFMRIHRSYIVNLTKIQEVNKNRVILDSHTYLPIGDMYKEAFQAYLNTRFLGKK